MKQNEMYLTIKDGGFLQSAEWFLFQEKLGKKIIKLKKKECFSANAIEHKLPLVGSYLFVPRGPIFFQKEFVEQSVDELLKGAKETRAAWVRIEPQTKEELEALKLVFEK